MGDEFIDKYTYCKQRTNPESNAPCFNILKEKEKPGGAGNVRECLLKFREKVVLISSKDNLIVKQRFLNKNGEQLMRVDLGNKYSEASINQLKKIKRPDVILISDYAKGTMTKKIVKKLKKFNVPIFVDTKPKNLSWYKGVFLIKPNAKEAKQMTGETDLIKAGEKLLKKQKSSIMITNGGKGIIYFDYLTKKYFTISGEKVPFKDVTGAGDTVISAFVHYFGKGKSILECTKLSNIAGAISVQHIGCYQPSDKEIKKIYYSTELVKK